MSENRSIIPRPTAGAIIVKENKVLLEKRAVEPFKGYWTLPGGKIEFGETAEQAVKREIKEELNVALEIDHFQGYYDEIFPQLNIHYVALIFVGTITGEIKPNKEVADWKWFPIEEALTLNLAFKNKEALEAYHDKTTLHG